MMVKLVALYQQPEDKERFDAHYFEVHLPLVEKMPNLLKTVVTRYSTTPLGNPSPFYLQAEMFFKSQEALQTAMRSPEGKAVAKDVMSFAGSGVSIMIGEELP